MGEATDGQTAVALARQLRPDVITMDIAMPGLDSIAGTRAIHAKCPAIRIIGLSMFEEPDRSDAMRAAGAVGYLTRGGSADALLAAIRTVVKQT